MGSGGEGMGFRRLLRQYHPWPGLSHERAGQASPHPGQYSIPVLTRNR